MRVREITPGTDLAAPCPRTVVSAVGAGIVAVKLDSGDVLRLPVGANAPFEVDYPVVGVVSAQTTAATPLVSGLV